MHTWYRAVCDECKEYCHVFVISTFHLRVDLLEDVKPIVMCFLSKHYGCQMRIVHNDLDMEKLYDEYLDVEKLKGDALKTYLNVYADIYKEHSLLKGDIVLTAPPLFVEADSDEVIAISGETEEVKDEEE